MKMEINSDLINFMRQESPKELKRVVLLSLFVGFISTTLIALVNESASKVANSESVTPEFFLFLFALTCFLIVIRKSTRETISSSQNLIHKFKMRIMKDVFLSDLSTLDSIGKVNILQALGRDAQTVSQSMPILVMVCQGAATLVCLSLYMATISLVAFFIILFAVIIIFIVSSRYVLSVSDDLKTAWKKEADIHEIFSDFLNGFKEIKLNSSRAREITMHMVGESRASSEMKADALISLSYFFNYLQILLYIIVGLIIFVVPNLSDNFSSVVVPSTTAAIFLVGSLTGIITCIPNLSESNVSASSLLKLEQRITGSGRPMGSSDSQQEFRDASSLRFDHLMYQHKKDDPKKSFVFGPISYEFLKGNIYFIRGNNGSGKTTFMRLLTGLYSPDEGNIYVDGVLVSQPTSTSYRDMFSVVFGDFFLFKNLYGLSDIEDAELNYWKVLFQIDTKVSIEDGKFSNLDLSTGQKKRVALLVAILEKRQFIVLDEWAADQDPEFRKIFYTEIIPMLKKAGKTIIAITHDDQYFGIADHLLTINAGQLITDGK
jgi:putative pyoverdin transport system ATP-binding/permease protein